MRAATGRHRCSSRDRALEAGVTRARRENSYLFQIPESEIDVLPDPERYYGIDGAWRLDCSRGEEGEAEGAAIGWMHWTARVNHAHGEHENVRWQSQVVYRTDRECGAVGGGERRCAKVCAPNEGARSQATAFYAKRDIRAGEELAFDYGYLYWVRA